MPFFQKMSRRYFDWILRLLLQHLGLKALLLREEKPLPDHRSVKTMVLFRTLGWRTWSQLWAILTLLVHSLYWPVKDLGPASRIIPLSCRWTTHLLPALPRLQCLSAGLGKPLFVQLGGAAQCVLFILWQFASFSLFKDRQINTNWINSTGSIIFTRTTFSVQRWNSEQIHTINT